MKSFKNFNKVHTSKWPFYVSKDQVKEEVPANVTGAAVVGTGDNPVHWRNRKKKKPTMLKRLSQF